MGKTPTDGYEYDELMDEVDEQIVGLPLDEDNQKANCDYLVDIELPYVLFYYADREK